jgi:hypothetical protein
MATPSQDELNKIRSLLNEINDLYNKIGGTNPFSGFNTRNITDAAASIGQLEAGLRDAKKTFDSLTDGAQELYGAFKGIVNEIKNSNSSVRDSTKSYSKLGELARKLRDDQKGISTLNKEDLKSIQSKIQSEAQNLRLATEMAKVRMGELNQRYRARTLTDREFAERKEIARTINTNTKFLQEQEGILDETNRIIKERLEKEKQIQKNLGLTGALLKGISKIPILSNLIDAEEALAAAQEEAARTGSNRLKVLGAVFKSLGASLKKNLTDPLVVGGLLLKGFKMFIELGFEADKQITEMSKSMAVTKDEAALTRDRFVEIQKSTNDITDGQLQNLITTKNLVEAQGQLAKSFGATRGFTDAQLKDQIMLTKQVGLEEEVAADLQQLALANGKLANDILKSTVKQTASLAKQTGVQLDNKKILTEVAKVSGQLRLQYQNNPDLIAKAVIQTQKLGISLEQAKNIAEKLLDFESSITSELEAELLTGRSLNLENARLLALQGDSAGAVAEIARQMGNSAEFSKLNVIAQQSLAQAVGMNADELANSLVYQENLAELGSETRKQVEEEIKLAKEQGDIEKVRMLERSIGNEENALNALKELSAQEKFNAAVDKLKSMLASIVEGPAAKFVDKLGNMVSSVDSIKQAFGGIMKIIGGISLARMIGQLGIAAGLQAMLAAGAITWASGITLGLGIIAVLAGMTAAYSGYSDITDSMQAKVKKTNDGIIDPKGGLVVSGPEGSIQLNKKDSIIAGTNLGGGEGSLKDSVIAGTNLGDRRGSSKDSIIKDNSGGGINSSTELSEIKNILSQILNKNANVYMDSNKVGTALNLGSVNIQ